MASRSSLVRRVVGCLLLGAAAAAFRRETQLERFRRLEESCHPAKVLEESSTTVTLADYEAAAEANCSRVDCVAAFDANEDGTFDARDLVQILKYVNVDCYDKRAASADVSPNADGNAYLAPGGE